MENSTKGHISSLRSHLVPKKHLQWVVIISSGRQPGLDETPVSGRDSTELNL